MSRPHRALDPLGRSARARAWVLSRSRGWRLSVPVACACAGLLASTSAINARGTDLRAGRHTDLIGLVSAQKEGAEGLQRTVGSLEAEVDLLSRQVGGVEVTQVQREIDELEATGGLAGLRGSGLVISLDDAPFDQPGIEGVDPNTLVVHQQDVQAVVNALWAGGADGISLQGQRVISTTGIKCVGNAVLLQGVPYAPPYRIRALGDPGHMYDTVVASPRVQSYLDYTKEPYNLGWSLRAAESMHLPAYTGPLEVAFAQMAVLPGERKTAD